MENEAKNINAIKKPKRQCDHPDCKKNWINWIQV